MTAPDREEVSRHMLRLGLGALAHSNWHSNYYSHENALWPELSVLQAAHAAEILVKARIAEEHPLLLFEQLPSVKKAGGQQLGVEHLIEHGRTYQWSDLPDRLWATTGLVIPDVECFRRFGFIRNQIQHFAPPSMDLSLETIRFTFRVIDPFINQCWDLFAIDYNEDHEPYVYLIENLVRVGVPFLVSKEAARDFEHAHPEWPDDDYKALMQTRVLDALGGEE